MCACFRCNPSSAHIRVDGWITKAPCGREIAGPSPVDRTKQGTKRSITVDGAGIPLATLAAPANRHDLRLLAPTLDMLRSPCPPARPLCISTAATTPGHPHRTRPPWLAGMHLQARRSGSPSSHRSMGRGAHQRVAQHLQETRLVHRTSRRTMMTAFTRAR